MKIIAFNGARRTGKDSAALYIQEELTKLNISHATVQPTNILHNMLEALYPGWTAKWEDNKDLPGYDTRLPNGSTMRTHLIKFSNIMKGEFGNGIFTERVFGNFTRQTGVDVGIVTDIGVPGDFDILLNHVPREDILLIRLARDGFSFDDDVREHVDGPDAIFEGDDVGFKNRGSFAEVLEFLGK